MRPEEIKQAIEKARARFEVDLKSEGYSNITANYNQLEKILSVSKPENGEKYLDIGTGAGYVAFELARRYPQSDVTGIDITESIIAANNQKANESGLQNLEFKPFLGKEFPFPDGSFDGIFSRYSFHHFPLPCLSVQEISRILKYNGFFFITDPAPYVEDNVNFCNSYSELRNDGHIKYYYETELPEMFFDKGLKFESIFYDEISFPRIWDSRYKELLDRTPRDIKDAYKIKRNGNEVYITLRVMNILFRKYLK